MPDGVTFMAVDSPVTASATGRTHFAALDTLRGLAALLVVFYHITWLNPLSSLTSVHNGYLAVDIFFVLSGFVIFYAYRDRLDTGARVGRFMWLRFWRIYPLHFAFLFVFLGIECLKFFLASHYAMQANHPAFQDSNFYTFLTNLLLLQAMHTAGALSYNGPSWSISVEFFAYILFAALSFFLRKRGAMIGACMAATVAGFGFLVALGPNGVTRTFDFGFARCLCGFFLGTLVFALYDILREQPAVRANSRWLGAGALLSMLALVAFLSLRTGGYSDLGIYPLSALMILLIALARVTPVTGFLYSAPARWLGTVSYSIYMVHDAVLFFVKAAMRFGLHAHDGAVHLAGELALVTEAVAGIAGAVVAVFLILLTAHFTYRWIEMPFRDWSRKAYVLKAV